MASLEYDTVLKMTFLPTVINYFIKLNRFFSPFFFCSGNCFFPPLFCPVISVEDNMVHSNSVAASLSTQGANAFCLFKKAKFAICNEAHYRKFYKFTKVYFLWKMTPLKRVAMGIPSFLAFLHVPPLAQKNIVFKFGK